MRTRVGLAWVTEVRISVDINNPDGERIPFDYQYSLASAMYSKLKLIDEKLARDLHESKGFRHFCFSNLLLGDHESDRQGLRFSKAKLIISSPSEEFIRDFAEGFLLEPQLRIDSAILQVAKVEILPKNEFDSVMRLRTLSPIITRTIRENEGEKIEWELYPRDGKFYDNIHSNLMERYMDFHGVAPDNDCFEITQVHWFKPKRVSVAGTPRRCSLMEFTMTASEELMDFAFHSGLGEKQAMGFGCVGLVENS